MSNQAASLLTKYRDKKIAEVAEKHLKVQCLETRHRDDLDFPIVTVWELKAALEAAYLAGQLAGREPR